MTILSGWREQYERMLRTRARLTQIADGRVGASSDEARDALFHFFQDAYHLKDWIKNDLSDTTVEDLINKTPSLRLCADLCNGTKHFRLRGNGTRTGDASTSVDSQSVIARPGAIGQRAEPPIHGWTVASEGESYDAIHLAESVVRDWETWLQTKGLL